MTAPAIPFDATTAAAELHETKGPVADLARGVVPACFGRLRRQLADEVREAQTTAAVMSMHDDPGGEPFWDAGEAEIAEILRKVSELHRWAGSQECSPAVCECRADRVLRRLLTEARVPATLGYRRGQSDRRPVGLLVGNPYPEDGPVYPVRVSHRGSIDHMVRLHRGWRAQLQTDAGWESVYESPLYPLTPVEDYARDTEACARAIVDALR